MIYTAIIAILVVALVVLLCALCRSADLIGATQNRPQPRRNWRRRCWKVGLLAIIAVGTFVLAIWSEISLKQWWESAKYLAIPAAFLVGTICGQAKDAASQVGANQPIRLQSTGGWAIRTHIRLAWTQAWADKNSAAFLFRSLEWGALALAAALLSKLLPP